MLLFLDFVTAPSLLLLAVVLLACALAGSGVSLRLFSSVEDEDRRRDAALALSVVFGLLLLALPGWLLSAFARVPIGGLAIPLGLAALAAALLLTARELPLLWKEPRRLVMPLAVPLAVFAFFLWLRLPTNEVRQTEKPMDAAILNTLLLSPELPARDPWFAGERLPYYHFGSFVLGVPMRTAGVAPEYAYNLLVALLGALVAAGAFAAVRLRGGGRGPALFAALFLTLAGTFDGAAQVFGGRPLWDIDVWVSSRRVANTITEWPFFTLKLGDLHPHLAAMPLFVALVAVAGRVATLPGLVLDAVLLGALLSANPWDLPAALLVLAAGNLAERSFGAAFVRSVLAVVLSIPVLVPFLRAPRPEFRGLRLVNASTTSPEAFLHFGGFVAVLALAFGVAVARSRRRDDESLLLATLFPALGIALAIVTKRPVLGLAVAFLVGVAFLVFGEAEEGARAARASGAVRAGLLLAGAGTALAALPEVLAVKDSYGEAMHRMNTVFKSYHGAAMIFGVATALLLPLALATRRARWTIRGVLLVALAGTLFHPVGAVVARFKFSGPSDLDGLLWMKRETPGDFAAVAWLRKNAPLDAVVVEAVGGAYTDHARIGTHSGRPTLLGWTGHQGLWRGEKSGEEIGKREAEIRLVFTSSEELFVADALAKHRAAFVVVGPLERKDYGDDAFPLRSRFPKAFEEAGTALYDVRGARAAPPPPVSPPAPAASPAGAAP